MSAPLRPSDLAPSGPAATGEGLASQATPSPAELALTRLERLLASLERAPARLPASNEDSLARVLTCAPPPPRVAGRRTDAPGESAEGKAAGAGAVPAARRRRRSPARTAALILTGGAVAGAMFAFPADAPGLLKTPRLVVAYGAAAPAAPLLGDAVSKPGEAPPPAKGDAEAAGATAASTPKPVEIATPRAGAAFGPPASVDDRTQQAATIAAPIAAPPAAPPPESQAPALAPAATSPQRTEEAPASASIASVSNDAASAGAAPDPSGGAAANTAGERPVAAAPDNTEKPGPAAKPSKRSKDKRKSAKAQKGAQPAGAAAAAAESAAAAEPAESGGNPLLGAFPLLRAVGVR